ETLPGAVARLLRERAWTVAVAESCTGGLVTHLLSTVPGVSESLLAGVVTYANDAKAGLADVPEEAIRVHGAVSDPVARAMADGIRRRVGADVGLSTTGIAGPSGGTPEKPVGLVLMACATPDGVRVERHHFLGERTLVQERAARTAL